MVRQCSRRLTIKIVFLMLKNEEPGRRTGSTRDGLVCLTTSPKTRLASSWGVCAPACMLLCVQNTMDGGGLSWGKEVTSGRASVPTQGLDELPLGSFPGHRAQPPLWPWLPSFCSRSPSQNLPSPGTCGKLVICLHPAPVPAAQSVFILIFWPQGS